MEIKFHKNEKSEWKKDEKSAQRARWCLLYGSFYRASRFNLLISYGFLLLLHNQLKKKSMYLIDSIGLFISLSINLISIA